MAGDFHSIQVSTFSCETSLAKDECGLSRIEPRSPIVHFARWTPQQNSTIVEQNSEPLSDKPAGKWLLQYCLLCDTNLCLLSCGHSSMDVCVLSLSGLISSTDGQRLTHELAAILLLDQACANLCINSSTDGQCLTHELAASLHQDATRWPCQQL